jgi:two-component system sensor histidine kinase FlrB
MNALQSCQQQACIQLNVRSQNNALTFVVKDNGCGISKNLQAKITEPFFTTKSNGTGLGLAVVKTVAEAHQGFMHIQSTVGIGSEIGFTIPVYKTSH